MEGYVFSGILKVFKSSMTFMFPSIKTSVFFRVSLFFFFAFFCPELSTSKEVYNEICYAMLISQVKQINSCFTPVMVKQINSADCFTLLRDVV